MNDGLLGNSPPNLRAGGGEKRASLNSIELEGTDDTIAALSRKGGLCCGGVTDDAKRRSRHCWSDWADSFRSVEDASKTCSSALFMFMALFFVEVALAEAARDQTDNAVGVTEFMLLISLSGIVQSLVGAQPLVVLRPTGPIVLTTVSLFQLSGSLWPAEADDPAARVQRFYQLASATGFFVAVNMTIIATFELSRFCDRLTQFTLEIFEVFVCSVLIYEASRSILDSFDEAVSPPTGAVGEYTFGDALFSLVLTFVVFALAMLFSFSGSLRVFTPGVRSLLIDYALPLGVFAAVALSYVPGPGVVRRIPMPPEFSPTFENPESGPRDWGVNVFAVLPTALGGSSPWYCVLVALASSIPVTALFYVDQNVTGLLLQQPSNKLSKGSYYHASFLFVGIINGMCVSPIFIIACTVPCFYHWIIGSRFDGAILSSSRERSRIMTRIQLLELLPEGATSGVLLYVGFRGFITGNEFWERLLLLFASPSEFPGDKPYSAVPWQYLHMYTLIQAVCFGMCYLVGVWGFGIGLGLAFPIVIVGFVPLRAVLTKVFPAEYLELLDRRGR